MSDAIQTGQRIEDLAVEYLQNADIIIMHRNFRCKYGEIDIIALDQKTLIFIEVRYRKNVAFGHPMETVTIHKQRKIIATAQYFLQFKNWASNLACRFDVLAVLPVQNEFKIEWVKDAFHV